MSRALNTHHITRHAEVTWLSLGIHIVRDAETDGSRERAPRLAVANWLNRSLRLHKREREAPPARRLQTTLRPHPFLGQPILSDQTAADVSHICCWSLHSLTASSPVSELTVKMTRLPTIKVGKGNLYLTRWDCHHRQTPFPKREPSYRREIAENIMGFLDFPTPVTVPQP